MKIYNPLILSLLLISTSLKAQKLIPRVALAVSSTTNTPTSPTGEVSVRKTIAFGLGVQLQIVKKIDLLLEVNYVSKGHEFYSNGQVGNDPNTRAIFQSTYIHNYLVIPVLVKKYFGAEKFQPYLSVGPYVGIGLGGQFKGEFGIYDRGFALAYNKYDGKIYYGEDPINSNNNDRYYSHSVDVGISIGTGVTLFHRIALDFRYEMGQRNVDEYFGDYKNRTIYLVVMVPIDLKK
jgi:hypothetical protein